MKKFILFLVLTTMVLSAQVKVLNTEVLDLGTNTIQPVFSEDGKYLLFGSQKGLTYYDLSKKKTYEIGENGRDYSMDSDGNIRYCFDSYENGRILNSVHEYNINKKSTNILLSKKRLEVVPKITKNGVYYIENKGVKSNTTSKSATTEKPVVFSYNHNLLVHLNGTTKTLKPVGIGDDNMYVWPSISPDNSQICFVNKNDLYITNLDGKIIKSLKDARAPQWSPNGEWIVFMRDYDDGHTFTESEIFIMHVADGNVYQLTNSENRIEMSPSWSPDGKQVICEDIKNDALILLTLDIN